MSLTMNILYKTNQLRLPPSQLFLAPRLCQHLKRLNLPFANGLHIRDAVFKASATEWSKLCTPLFAAISSLDRKLSQSSGNTPQGYLALEEVYQTDQELGNRCLKGLVRSPELLIPQDELPLREVSRMALSFPKHPERPKFRNLLSYILIHRHQG